MKKLRTLVLVGALGAVVAAVAKKLQAGQTGAATWQSADPVRSAPERSAPEAPAAPAATDVEAVPEEQLVDNAPAPSDAPSIDPEVEADLAGPQSVAPDPLTDPLPDPLTDPLPEQTAGDAVADGDPDAPRP